MNSVSVAQAAQALAQHYGLFGVFKAMPGEHDTNFLLMLAGNQRCAFKLHPAGFAPEQADLQASALKHLAQTASHLPVQRLLLAKDGVSLPVWQGRQLRLTSWLEGEVWASQRPIDTESFARSATSLGHMLAELDLALAGFTHPAARRDYLWDMAQARQHLAHLGYIDDAAKRQAVAAILQRFVSETAPRLANAPRQVIHNDANDHNVLLDAQGCVNGLIDFGDMVYSYRVAEVAVACAYALIGSSDPLAVVEALVTAYHAVNPLNEAEIDSVYDLILTRYAISMCMAARQIREQPQNRYLLISQQDVWRETQTLLAAKRRMGRACLRVACGFEPVQARRSIVDWLQTQECAALLDRSMALDDLLLQPLDAAALRPYTSLQAYDAAMRAKANGRTLVGCYGEDRVIYTWPEFAAANGAQARTVHLGVDLRGELSECVMAPLAGHVAEIANESIEGGFGGLLILQHSTDNGTPFWTLYGHLSPDSLLGLEPGQRVEKGQVLARLGGLDDNGGWPAHLHFQILTDRLDCSAIETPGVAARRQWPLWRSVCPDPNLILRLPLNVAQVVEADPAPLLARRRKHLGKALSLAY